MSLPDDFSTAKPGAQVTVRYDDGTEETLTLVGPSQADPVRGYVSMDSPAGRALLGKAPGTDVKLGAGDEALELAIVSIGKPDTPVSGDGFIWVYRQPDPAP